MERELIDLNELKKWKHKRIQSGECSYDDMVALGKFIEDVPRVDAVRGEWEEKETFCIDDDPIIERWQSARCSMCERYHTTPYMYYFNDYNFCPNCGADMRGADDEVR